MSNMAVRPASPVVPFRSAVLNAIRCVSAAGICGAVFPVLEYGSSVDWKNGLPGKRFMICYVGNKLRRSETAQIKIVDAILTANVRAVLPQRRSIGVRSHEEIGLIAAHASVDVPK
jgi:hypothetical protein